MAIIITGGQEEYQRLLDDMRALVRHELQAQPAIATTTLAADELLTVQQAAILLDVSVATIHEHKRTGKLPYQKLGGRAYLKRSDLLNAGTYEQRSVKPTRIKHR